MNSTDPWDELCRRYPWPDTVPDVPWTEHGWCGAEIHEYFDRFLSDKTRLIIEIGSWLGLSARYQLKIAPNAKMICIDHWTGSSEHHKKNRTDVMEYLPTLYERFIKRMWEYRDRLVAMRSDSVEAIAELAGLGFKPDFIYVDGSHDTDSVSADIQACIKHFPDAQIMGDDWRLASIRIAVWRAMRGFERPIEHNRLAWAFTAEDE